MVVDDEGYTLGTVRAILELGVNKTVSLDTDLLDAIADVEAGLRRMNPNKAAALVDWAAGFTYKEVSKRYGHEKPTRQNGMMLVQRAEVDLMRALNGPSQLAA